jgi:hypothetical protein
MVADKHVKQGFKMFICSGEGDNVNGGNRQTVVVPWQAVE